MWKMRTLLAIILPFFLLGCSGVAGTVTPDIEPAAADSQAGGSHWNWGYWTFAFSEDHTKIEVVPFRGADYHFCVTKFMEIYPCDDCLIIGNPQPQGDGTVKFSVTLKHPFPNTPKYTGFDVRGMVYFPPTMNQTTSGFFPYSIRINGEQEPGFGNMPLKFSRAADGGGEVLNADGYSCYLIPGITYSENYPIYNYQPGIKGNEPTPQTTITPYLVFASDNERRMFLASDEITRVYHLSLPPGPFNFGYAVDASWWPPSNIPVTDPLTDFPREANAEDPWLIEYEQVAPIREDTVDEPIFKVTIHHRGIDEVYAFFIYAWDIASDGGEWQIFPQFKHIPNSYEIIDDFTTVVYGRVRHIWWSYHGEDGGAIPGHHFGILVVMTKPDWDMDHAELVYIIGAQFIDLYVEG